MCAFTQREEQALKDDCQSSKRCQEQRPHHRPAFEENLNHSLFDAKRVIGAGMQPASVRQ